MTNLVEAEALARKLREEPYVLFRNDCITKSIRLKRMCRAVGIEAQVVVCLGLARARWFRRWLTIPAIHAWGEVAGKRIETSRPLGSSGIWGIIPMNIRAILRLRW